MALTIDSREVNLAAQLLRDADKDLRKEMMAAVRREGLPWLRHAIRRNAKGRQDVKIANTARIRGGQKPGIVVGASGKIGREPIRNLVRQYEFGSYREFVLEDYWTTSRNGTRYKVARRHTQRQLPWFKKTGRMVYPSISETAPQIVSMWLGILTSTYREATDGR